jgi:DNA recombination protein RmuC
MFVPVEPAYIAAMHGDPDLWQYAYKRGIFLISPANLIATLKLVKDLWRKDAVDKNAQKIAEKAGKLYDKLVNFVEAFEMVGEQLDKAGETWEKAHKQLTAGKGNLLSQALKMQALHIHSKKELPPDLANAAVLNDHFGIGEKPADGVSLFE